MKELTLREAQQGELAVAKEFDKICRELGLDYCLAYGTLIGAVRHGGFIPWDDDIDIMMPRPDYDELIKYLSENKEKIYPLELMHYTTNDKYIYPIARLSDSRYGVKYNRAKDYGLGLFIDIYPMDGVGNDPELGKELINGQMLDIKKMNLAGTDKYYRSNGGLLRDIPKFLFWLYANIRGPKHYAAKLDRNGQKYDYADSKYIAETNWELPIVYEKEWFFPTEYGKFEDTVLRLPKNYDKVLRVLYGDYMQLPPVEDRRGHHDYIAFEKSVEDRSESSEI